MQSPKERAERCLSQLKERLVEMPKVGIVLGSGLGALADEIENPTYIPYAKLEGFPVSTAPGHAGRYVAGRLEGVPVILMQGRIHLYEGWSVEDAVLPVRLMALLGVEAILLTNAAGAIRDDIAVGDFCLLKDHISLLVPSPLRGANEVEWGPRFPDMTEVYDPEFGQWLHAAAEQAECKLHDGVYVQTPGPAYETPAEVRMLRTMGADMTGMSTVIEAMAIHHMGTRVAAVSLATNKAAGLGGKLTEQEVIDEGNKAAQRFQKMVRIFLRNFAK